jgi:Late exocytosis, associated with Golgi transport/Cytosolic domain of 10TM putative phosphate transporter
MTTNFTAIADYIQDATNLVVLSTNSSSTDNGQVLIDTFAVYGTTLLFAFLLFCWVRLKYPNAYNIRKQDYNNTDENNYIHDNHTDWRRFSANCTGTSPRLAEDQHGFLAWAWKVFQITDDDFVEENGLDAACLVRICAMGYRFTMTGVFVSIWLLPIYATAGGTFDNPSAEDKLVEITTGNVPDDSPQLIATTVATYIVFGHAMYVILKEMEWFTTLRHQYLMQPKPKNYTVYVRNIPKEFRSNRGLKGFFEKSLRGAAVQQSHICLRINKLRKKVKQRDNIIEQLEHVVAVEDLTGERPRHVPDLMIPKMNVTHKTDVDSIDYYADRLNALNAEITILIDALQEKASNEPAQEQFDSERQGLLRESFTTASVHPESDQDKDGACIGTECIQETVMDSDAARMTMDATEMVTKAATGAVKLVLQEEDGEMFSAGFLVFGTLSITHAALQMVHHGESMARLLLPDL